MERWRAKPRNVRLAALSMSSMDMKIVRALRRDERPTEADSEQQRRDRQIVVEGHHQMRPFATTTAATMAVEEQEGHDLEGEGVPGCRAGVRPRPRCREGGVDGGRETTARAGRRPSKGCPTVMTAARICPKPFADAEAGRSEISAARD